MRRTNLRGIWRKLSQNKMNHLKIECFLYFWAEAIPLLHGKFLLPFHSRNLTSPFPQGGILLPTNLSNHTLNLPFTFLYSEKKHPMNRQEISELINELEVSNIKFGVTDIDGVLRGKMISPQKFLKALNEDIGFCNVIFGWDVGDQCYENTKISGWHTGYPDEFATIDPTTYRRIPWEEGKPFFLADFSQAPTLTEICPRSLLKRIDARARKMGFIPKFSAEFEWVIFKESPLSLYQKNYEHLTPLSPGMFGYSELRSSQNSEFLNQLWDDLNHFGIPLEGLHTETGPGVYEAAIEYDEIVVSADRAALFKTAVKEISARFELLSSFMAKWHPDLPGNSGHLHQSLWDEAGSNLFFDEQGKDSISSLMESYIAGQLHCMPYIMPLFAPTINSYRRLVAGTWAPTSASWGIENRTTALRVINHSANSMRVENRLPGADANPYLSMAASLASGLYGIEHQLKLNTPPTRGNQYENKTAPALPTTLEEAVKNMKNSDLPFLLFGEEFTDHFLRTREWELEQYQSNIPTWELQRYLEII